MDDNERNAHQFFAIEAFNAAWELLDKADRTPEEDDEMLQRAFASRWHWGFVGGPQQFATGDWQISRAAAMLGFGLLAEAYALRALAIAEAEGFTDWGLASIYEGVARAAAVNGNVALHAEYYGKTKTAIAAIAEDDERKVIEDQFADVPVP